MGIKTDNGMKIKGFTLGADPEFPILNANNKPVSIEGRIGGTKKEPLAIGEGCYVQEDGVAFEINIPPVRRKHRWMKYIKYCIERGNIMLNIGQGDKGKLRIGAASSLRYREAEISTPQARRIACDKSYCVYTQDPIEVCFDEEDPTLRTFGFHVHVAWPGDLEETGTLEKSEDLIRVMEVFLGVPSVIIDLDENRSKIYKTPGDFRFKHMKDEGLVKVEYRVLGGNLLSSDKLMSWVFDNTISSINYFNFNDITPIKNAEDWIYNTIAHRDQHEAYKIIDHFKIALPTDKGDIITVDNENFVYIKSKNNV